MYQVRWALAERVFRAQQGRAAQGRGTYALLYEIISHYGPELGLELSQRATQVLEDDQSSMAEVNTPFLTASWQGMIEELLEHRGLHDKAAIQGPLAKFASSADVCFFGSTLYPESLYDCARPAPIIWHLGARPDLLAHEDAMAVVGSRSATAYGLRVASDLATLLVQLNLPLISGLAIGIDSAAQWSALKQGGQVMGVMPGGLNHPYPHSSWELYKEVAKTGLLISLFPPVEKVHRWHFPVRNHLIAGLAAETFVIEGAEHSGSLLTAHAALEMGKEIWAVPGSIYQPASRAGNGLIADGANPLYDFAVLEKYLKERYGVSRQMSSSQLQGEAREEKFQISLREQAELKTLLLFLAEENKALSELQERWRTSPEELREMLGYAMATGLVENLGGKFVLTGRGLSVIY